MQLNVGDQMLIQFGTFGDRLLSVVVDIDEGRQISIFLQVPPIIIERIQKINTVTAQFVFESTLMGFSTTILSWCNSPTCVIQLVYPDTIEAQDQRKEKRLSCNFPATLTANGRPYRCLIENLSKSGVRLRVIQPTDLNVRCVFEGCEKLVLDFFVLEERNTYTFPCQLRHEFIKDSQRYAVLIIPETETSIRRILESYIQAVFGALETVNNTPS